MRIGLAGIGRMGAAMALRLIDCGHELTVWNRTADKTKPLSEAGARVAATPAQLVNASDVILTIVTDARAVEDVYLGQDGLVSAASAGKLFIEMSTVRPEIKKKIAAALAARGSALVDCPVGGTIAPAREGNLLGFVGGQAADVERARPILQQLCRRLEHVGPVGAGASMKLAINLPLLVFWQALGEALLLCRPLKLDPGRAMEIFADTSGGPNVLKARGPTVAAALAGKPVGPPNFDIDSIRKDLRTMIEEARALGARLPVAERALECFDEVSAQGFGAEDSMTLPALWLRRESASD